MHLKKAVFVGAFARDQIVTTSKYNCVCVAAVTPAEPPWARGHGKFCCSTSRIFACVDNQDGVPIYFRKTYAYTSCER